MSEKIKKLIAECRSTLDGIDCNYYGKDEIIIDKILEDDEYSGIEYVERQLEEIRDSLDIISLDFQQAQIVGSKKEKG